MPKLIRKEIEQEKQNVTATIPPEQAEDTFDPMQSFGRTNMPPPNLEKEYSPTTSPEEIYKAEMDLIKNSLTDLPEMITKMEEEQEQNPVGQPRTMVLPHQAPPTNTQIPRAQEQPPQIPGAATSPEKPMNPLAGYQPPQQDMKPESGLPWRPPGGGGGFPKSAMRFVTEKVQHDCVTVHGFQSHEDWLAEKEKKPFFRA